MAVGFPTKVSYVDGDVFSASDINDTNGTINLIKPTAKGDLFAGSAANTYTKLAVGTDGKILTASSGQATGLEWKTPESMVLISTTAASGTTVVLSSIPQTYKKLVLVVENLVPSITGSIRLTPNAGTGDTTITNGGASTSRWNENLYITGTGGTNAGQRVDATITIDNYTSTTDYKPWISYGRNAGTNSSTTIYPFITAGAITFAAALTSVTFMNTTGATFSGTIKLYGVN